VTRASPATLTALILISVVGTLAGCRQETNRIVVTAYSDPHSPEQYYQDFDRAAFSSSGAGQYEILLESSEGMDTFGRQVLYQALHGRIFWRPLPGKTYAEASQINAQIDYQLRLASAESAEVSSQTPRSPIYYQGSGFISFSFNRDRTVMRGRIERALLEPRNAEISRLILKGKFTARRNPQLIAEYKITKDHKP